MEKRTKQSWTARPAREEDREAILELYGAASGKHIEGPEWEWKFLNCPAGRAYIHVADVAGAMAGQYALVPLRMKIRNRLIRGAQSLDTMTHPDYRKQGIFVTLAKEVYQEAASQDVELIYGFPNENSTPGFLNHLNFFVMEELPIFWRPLRTGTFLGAKLKNRPLGSALGAPAQYFFDLAYPVRAAGGGLRVNAEESFPSEETDALFHELSENFGNLVVRDEKYLNWRYKSHPRFKYDILLAWRDDSLRGYCVFEQAEHEGIPIGRIMDLFAAPDDVATAEALLARALKELAARGAAAAMCLLNPFSPFCPLLKKTGFLYTLRKNSFILRINSDTIFPSMIRNVGDWHITYGDGDFV